MPNSRDLIVKPQFKLCTKMTISKPQKSEPAKDVLTTNRDISNGEASETTCNNLSGKLNYILVRYFVKKTYYFYVLC